jgi:hypothetical protein
MMIIAAAPLRRILAAGHAFVQNLRHGHYDPRGSKLRLADIDPRLVEEAMRPGHRLVARIRLTGTRGNPPSPGRRDQPMRNLARAQVKPVDPGCGAAAVEGVLGVPLLGRCVVIFGCGQGGAAGPVGVATILQAHYGVSDDEVIEAAVMDRRWQAACPCGVPNGA